MARTGIDMATPSAASTYAGQLLDRGYGLPLWRPEPTGFGEVEIGDVGFVDDGAFHRLFNAMRPRDDALNSAGIPKGFVQLRMDERFLDRDDKYLFPGPIFTRTMTCTKVATGTGASDTQTGVNFAYSFRCNGEPGAIAVLGDYGRRACYAQPKAFRHYIKKHHHSWYEFARRQGHDVQVLDLVLVYGWVKTSRWALATFASEDGARDISFSATADGFPSARFDVATCSSANKLVEQRAVTTLQTPSLVGGREDRPVNQCLFLRYYKTRTRAVAASQLHVQAKTEGKAGGSKNSDGYSCLPCLCLPLIVRHRRPQVKARDDSQKKKDASSKRSHNSEPSDDARSSDAGSKSALSFDGEKDPKSDPLDIVANYILKRTSVRMAITSHDDLDGLLPFSRWPDDIEEYLNATAHPAWIDTEGDTGWINAAGVKPE